MSFYNDGPIVLDTTTYGGIFGSSINPGIGTIGDASSGSVDTAIKSVVGVSPRASFSTLALSTLLAAIYSSTPKKHIYAFTGNGFYIYRQQHNAGGTRKTGSNHSEYRMRQGMLIPRSLSVAHGGDAVLTCEAIGTYDGTNEIMETSHSAALPTIADDNERFGLGLCTIGNLTLRTISNIEIDWGLNEILEARDGDIRPTHVSVATHTPRITITAANLAWLGSSGVALLGLAGTRANTTIYLRKRTVGGVYVADGTSAHVKIQCTSLITIGQAAGGGAPQQVTIMLEPYNDGTNPLLEVTTGSTIT